MKKKKNQMTYEAHFNEMATKEFNDDILALLKSRCPLIYLTCNEEKRLRDYLKYMSASRGYKTYIWDCYLGCQDLLTGESTSATSVDLTSPEEMVSKIIEEAEQDVKKAKYMEENGISGNVYILLDFHRFINPMDVSPDMERRLKTFASISSKTSIIMTGPSFETSSALENYISVLDFPYPNEKEIKKQLWKIVNNVEEKIPNLGKLVKKNEDKIIKSANGLTLVEATAAYSKSLVLHRDFVIPTILKEKQQIIRKKGTLEFLEPKFSLDDVGGLGNLVDWLKLRLLAFHPDATDYGLPVCKGVLVVGISGTGKSLCAKAVSSLYQMPLLRLDFGRLFGSLQGESEARTRESIKLAEAVSPCVSGETMITFNSKAVKIQEVFSFAEKSNENEISIKNNNMGNEVQKIIYFNKNHQYFVGGVDDKYKYKDLKLKAIIRTRKTDKLIKIKTKSGKEILVTKNHLLLSNKKMKKAEDFTIGDKITLVIN